MLGTSASTARRLVALACALVFYAAPIWWVPATHDREFHHHGWQLVAACSFSLAIVVLIAALARTASRPTMIDLSEPLQHRSFVGPSV